MAPKKATKKTSTAKNKNKADDPKKVPKSNRLTQALQKAIREFWERRRVHKKAKPKSAGTTKPLWNTRRWLLLFMHVAKYVDIHLSEDEWRDIGDQMGRSWNSVRQQYGDLMGALFPAHKRRFKNVCPIPTATQKKRAGIFASIAGGPIEDLNPEGVRRRGPSRLNERAERPAYRGWHRWKKPAKVKGFKRFF